MRPATYSADLSSLVVFIIVVLVIASRLIRLARDYEGDGQAPGPPLWGPPRRLYKLQQETALVRGETDYLTSATDRLQAKANLERLSAELTTPTPAPQPQPQPAPAAALSAAEIDNLLHLLELDEPLRAEIMQLVASAIRDKRA
jgi:hypothetical protein